MAGSARRYLIIPERAWLDATVAAADNTVGTVREEAGLGVRQPDIAESTAPPVGDIRATLSGTPEVFVEGDLRLSRSGVVEHARFGWLREEDDPATDLQLRQSPMVVGRRPDNMSITIASDPIPYHNRPKLLDLTSGDALLMFQRGLRAPIFGYQGYASALFMATLDHETDTWSAPVAQIADPTSYAALSSAVANVLNTDYLHAADFTQFTDDGEIILTVLTYNASGPARVLYTFHSVDDGATWTERSRYYFQGSPPDLDLNSHGIAVADTSRITDCALELLPSGRLVLILQTQAALWSITSDDRGSSWSVAALVNDIAAAGFGFPGHGCAACRIRNGYIAVASAQNRGFGVGAVTPIFTWVTPDGVNFSAQIADATDVLSTDCAIVMRPDGFPHVYGTLAAYNDAAPVAASSPWARGAMVRDPGLATAIDDWMPMSAPARPLGFHLMSPQGNFIAAGATPSLHYGGPLGIDVIEYRGQLLSAIQICRQDTGDGSPTDPDLLDDALIVYRTNHWQPMQERLTGDDSLAGGALTKGYIYTQTWDCYGLPENWGWTLVGGATITLTTGGAEGGYVEIDSGVGAQGAYSIIGIAAAAHRDAALRVIMRCESGGSLIVNDCAILLRLRDSSSGNGYGVVVRLENTGTQDVALFDEASGVQLGVTINMTDQRWLEILVSVRGESTDTYGSLFVREYDRSADPDWDAPYEVAADDESGVTSLGAVASSRLEWGHLTSGSTAKSWWKGVHLHRTTVAFGVATPLAQRGETYIDTELNNKQTTGGQEGRYDTGVENYMRTSFTTAVPSQWLSRGVRASWRGEAITEGLLPHQTGYEFGAALIPKIPAVREWRSANTSVSTGVQLIFDAGASGLFRPSGMAVIGRNWPRCELRLSDTIPGLATPSLSYDLGIPGVGAPDRTTHLWALDIFFPAGWTYAVHDQRLIVVPPVGTNAPWRPHQFASQETGPRFYVCAVDGADTYVYEIQDNTDDTLLLRTAATLADFGASDTEPEGTNSFCIFSDRFAVLIDHRYSPTAAGIGYRYAALYLADTTHRDTDAAFYRLGCMVLGDAAELHKPDFQWGMARAEESGFDVQYQDDGTSITRRRSSPRRVLNLEYGIMNPAAEADEIDLSPVEPGYTRPWKQWLDAVRRLGVDGIHAALVFEGDRAYAETGEAAVQVTSDPADLMLARVTSAGSVEHVAYVGKTMNLAGGDECVPRPVAVVRGIQFTEEF